MNMNTSNKLKEYLTEGACFLASVLCAVAMFLFAVRVFQPDVFAAWLREWVAR